MGVARFLVTFGIAVALLGLAWPWLSKLGLGRLPGDILIERGQTRFYFPLASCVLVSVVASVLLYLFRR